jgi:protein-L-isoaspartate(D-aspartate) O-methyltransferase
VRTNADLIETLIDLGITDDRVLGAVRAVPRSVFVPPELRHRAYEDEPLPIPHGQVTTQPSLIARMIEALRLRGDERVLEVGTGYGFQTALLARMVSAVWSIERWAELAQTARANLAHEGIGNARVVVGDGTAGLPKHAPFDAIVVSAAFTSVPGPLADQLAGDGRLVQPIGTGGADDVVLFVRRPEGLVREALVTGAHFVRLVGAHAFAER